MAGAWKKDQKTMSLNTVMEITTWQQILKKENSLQRPKNLKEMTKMQGKLYDNNTYLNYFKSDDKRKRETIAETTGKNIVFVYDQAKRDEEASKDGYCQKCKRESLWCKDRRCRGDPKQENNVALTSSQVYGWREPIDTITYGYARQAVCHNNFHDYGHL